MSLRPRRRLRNRGDGSGVYNSSEATHQVKDSIRAGLPSFDPSHSARLQARASLCFRKLPTDEGRIRNCVTPVPVNRFPLLAAHAMGCCRFNISRALLEGQTARLGGKGGATMMRDSVGTEDMLGFRAWSNEVAAGNEFIDGLVTSAARGMLDPCLEDRGGDDLFHSRCASWRREASAQTEQPHLLYLGAWVSL
jgi:hypothetical protein